MPSAQFVLTAILGPPVLAGALICALAAGLAQLGRRSPSWDLLTHVAPIYVAAGLATMAFGLLVHDRYRLLALVFGAAALLGGLLLMAPEYLRPSPPKAPAGAPGAIKLIQFNAWGGKGGSGRILDWIAAQQPDVLVMQESTRTLREAVQTRTGLVLSGRRANVAIFSRQPPVAEVGPKSSRDAPMLLNGATFRTAAGETTVLGVHYPWPTEWDRMAGAGDLVRAVRAYPAETTILAGDFNSTPWSFARQREDRELGLIRRTRALFTWPVGRHLPFPLLPIDHVYAGSAWATVSVSRGPKLGSDHYPVVVILAPRGPSPGGLPAAPAQPQSSPRPPPAASPAPPLP